MPGGDDDVARSEPFGMLGLGALREAAAQLWSSLPPGTVIWLSGEMGSGKTTFVQMLCQAAGIDDATSPTYALVQSYATPDGPIYHVDCYRLDDPSEAFDLDLESLPATARLVCIEWPELAGPFAPPPDLHLRFSHTGDPARRRVERHP